MSEKNKILLTEDELKITADIHKKIMEVIGENCNFKSKEKQFYVITVIMAITICNIMLTFGIDYTDKYMDNFRELVDQWLEPVKKNSKYMRYKNGEKISEGIFS